jgi:hypothetical protein
MTAKHRPRDANQLAKVNLVLFVATVSIVLADNSFGQNETDRFFAKLEPQSAALGDCYRLQSIRLATLTCEPAATVIDAAFGSCGTQEKAYKDAMVRIGGATIPSENFAELADSIVAKVKVDTRQAILGIILETRIRAGRCSGNSN